MSSELTTSTRSRSSTSHTVRLRLKAPDASLVLAFTDRAGMMISPTAVQKLGDQFGRTPVARANTAWCAGSRAARRASSASPTTTSRAARTSTPSSSRSCPTPTRACPRCAAARSTSSWRSGAGLRGPQGRARPRAHEGPTLAYWRIFMNMAKPPSTRRAARGHQPRPRPPRLAQDHHLRARRGGQPAVPRELLGVQSQRQAWPHDPARAKAKLAEAGVPTGSHGHGARAHARARAPRGGLQAQLGAVGIKVDLKPMDLAKGVQAFFRSKELMAANYRWTGRPDPDQTVRGMFHSTGFYNPGGLKVPRVEELMDQAKATYKQDERRRFYQQIDEVVQQEAIDTADLRRELARGDEHERAGLPAQPAGQARVPRGLAAGEVRIPRGALPPPPAPGGGAAGDPRHVDGVLADLVTAGRSGGGAGRHGRRRARRSSPPSASGSASTARSSSST